MAGTDREKALDAALAQIERQFGKGAVMRMGERSKEPIEVISTGSTALDVALGVGGLPRGRVVEIYGPESSGKTTLTLHAVANAQKAGGQVAFVDAEHALDPEYAKKLGVDIDNLILSQPDNGEQALEIVDMLVRSGALDLIVIDSVAALVPRAEIEGEMGDSHVGLQARLMSQALRKITSALNQSKTTAIFINQLREKIGVMFGSPETTTGGRALKFYSSVRIDIRRIETLKDGTEAVGNRTRAKVVKNKCLAEGTRIFDPITGLTHDIADIVDGRKEVHVAALDKKGHFQVRPVVTWFDQGEQEVIGVRTRGGAEIWVTPDHKMLTDTGWVEAGQLRDGDLLARPRIAGGFGGKEPVSPEQARLLGYLVGDGYAGGKTPVSFINIHESLHQDAADIAGRLGCDAKRRESSGDGLEVAFSHRRGEKNGVLELCRQAGIWGSRAWEKKLPPEFFSPDVSAEVVANLLFGLLESDGWVSREQTGAVRLGFTTTSEQLAHQIHWLMLRWGIVSSVRPYDPTGQRGGVIRGRRVEARRPCWEVRVAGVDNVEAFARAIPMWGPRGRVLLSELEKDEGRRRGGQSVYVSSEWIEPVLGHLRNSGVTPTMAAQLIGDSAGDPRGGLRQVLGTPKMRRDRLEALADALEDPFLQEVVEEQLMFVAVREILPVRRARTFDVEVEELHNLVANDIVVHNCAPPFKQAEFDILYGQGISREGGLIDMGVEHGFVRKAGAWYTYEGDQLGQGKENARNFLKDNPDLANEIEKKIKEKLGVGVRPEEPAAEPGTDAPISVTAADGAAKTAPAPTAKAAKSKAATSKS
ncbi:intein-containing recombinase RecA [Streptomyces bluensis]|uniref:intein-containing recombinase RecA n=1 Tax=Streptomyces bluensis TaxID=33897 RepID=UPI0033208F53